MVRRIVLPEGALAEGELELPPDVAVHVRDVLRLQAGAALELTDGAGLRAEAVLAEVTRKRVRARASTPVVLERPATLALALYQCVAKGEKLDAVVRQATELGVVELVPVLSRRSVARLEHRWERWSAIAEDAVRVSGRAFRPRIAPVTAFAAVLERARAPLALCFTGGAAESLGAVLDAVAPPASAEVLIGPEGGLDDEEVRAAAAAGFRPVHLGPHTLRTETAGPAAAAILLHWAGAIAR